MKNEESWQPTKFVLDKKGNLRGSKKFNSGSRFIMEIQAEAYQRAVVEYIHGDLLDLGCGDAPLYHVYKPLVSSITCVDWADAFHENTYLDYIYDLNKPTDLPDASYDSIVMFDVLEHIAEPKVLMREVSRLLRPGGTAIITVPFYYPIHAQPYDFHRYTEFALKYMAEKNSLEVVELEAYGGFGEILFTLGGALLYKVEFLNKINYHLGTAFRKSFLGKKLKDFSTYKFPLGYVFVVKKGDSL